MRTRVLIAWLSYLCASCTGGPGATSAKPGPAPGLSPLPDPAAVLAARLPAGADRCVVARPAQLSPRRRALYAQVAQAGPLAWLGGVEVVAYASAERDRRRHAPAMVMLLQLGTGDSESVRSVIGERSGLDLRWDASREARCTPEACPTQARFVSPRVVRLQRGRWAGAGVRAGAEDACRQLLSEAPDALEVVAARRRDGDVGRRLGLPLRTTARVKVLERGARIERDDLMLGGEQAELMLAASGAGIERQPFGELTVDLARSRHDASVHTEAEVLWEDLQMHSDDRARRYRTESYGDVLESLLPPEQLDPADTAGVLEQARLWRAALRSSLAPGQPALADEARRFVEAALAVRPVEPALVEALVRMLLEELSDAPAALTVLEEQLAVDPSATTLRPLRRQAAARVSAALLAQALEADGLVRGAGALSAARRIRASLGATSDYAEVERRALSGN